jgi:hypothetical protein
MVEGGPHEYFVWATMPYGYTRAPFIAKTLMKPLVSTWRKMGRKIVVFYDDSMAVGNEKTELKKQALQIQCDLLRAGLVPGVKKCIWNPSKVLEWNGLIFDFEKGGISVMNHRMGHTTEKIKNILGKVAKSNISRSCTIPRTIKLNAPSAWGEATLRSKMLQTFINIRHFQESQWEKQISSDFPALFEKGKDELKFWQKNIEKMNFRPFHEPNPNCLGWVDASDSAVGGILVVLKTGGVKTMPVF